MFMVPPLLPYWLMFGINPKAFLTSSQWVQMSVGFINYAIMALCFVTARRRNGFAAVQDLLTGTRVVTRGSLATRPVHPSVEAPPPAVESGTTIRPYHVLQPLGESGGAKWFLAYDLKLLRQV